MLKLAARVREIFVRRTLSITGGRHSTGADYQRPGRNLRNEVARLFFAVRKQTQMDGRTGNLCHPINERLVLGMRPRGWAEGRIV